MPISPQVLKLFEQTCWLDRCLVGTGIDKFFTELKQVFDVHIEEFPLHGKFHTWKPPIPWEMAKASIKNLKGEVIVSTDEHPLCLWIGSRPIRERVSRANLFENHISWDEKNDQAIPYREVYYKNDWGFSIAKSWTDRFNDENFDINIQVFQPDTTLKIATKIIPGKSNKKILLVSHVDHPYQLADGLSGAGGLIEIGLQLEKIENLFSYQLLFVPETIGSLAFSSVQENLENVCYTVFVDGFSADAPINIQKTLDGDTVLDDTALNHAKNWKGIDTVNCSNFREIPGNDEIVFNGPGIGIPSLLIQRWPMPNYHNHLDNLQNLCEKRFSEAVDFTFSLLKEFEETVGVLCYYKGILSLSSNHLWEYYGTGVNRRKFEIATSMMDGNNSLAEIQSCSGFSGSELEDLIARLLDRGLICV